MRSTSPARCSNGPLLLWTMLFWLGQFLLGRLAWPRLVQVGKTRLLSFRVRRPKPYTATRRFIPHALGIEGFFSRLQAAERAACRAPLVRDTCRKLPAGEDLDLLGGR